MYYKVCYKIDDSIQICRKVIIDYRWYIDHCISAFSITCIYLIMFNNKIIIQVNSKFIK